MDEKASKIKKLNDSISSKNSIVSSNKSFKNKEDVRMFEDKMRIRKQKLYSIKLKRFNTKCINLHKHILTDTREADLNEATLNNELKNMIGFIDWYGLFLIDIETGGVKPVSSSILES